MDEDAVSEKVRAFYERHPYPPPADSLDDYRSLWQDPERVLAETTPCQRANNVDAARARAVVLEAFGPLPAARGTADSPPS